MEGGDAQGLPKHARRFFRWLHATGRRADDPAAALPKVRKTRPHPRPCPDVHIYAAMCAANDVERLMLRLGAEAGLRLSEIAAVHSRDVLEGDAGPSLIVRGKGDKQRIVPISEDLAKRITAAPGWLFPGRWRGHVEKSYVSATSHGCCRTVGAALAAPPVRHAHVRDHARSAAGLEAAGA